MVLFIMIFNINDIVIYIQYSYSIDSISSYIFNIQYNDIQNNDIQYVKYVLKYEILYEVKYSGVKEIYEFLIKI